MAGKICIVGLGYGDENALSLGVLKKMEQIRHIYLRTEKHPVVTWLLAQGFSSYSFDSLYKVSTTFEAVYIEIVNQLIQFASHSATPIIYAVPGHPMVAEKTVKMLLDKEKSGDIVVEVYGGGSFLDIAFATIPFDPIEGFLFLDSHQLEASMLNPQLHLLLGQVYSRMVASDVKLTLMEVYPDDCPIQVVESLGINGQEVMRSLPLFELDRGEYFHNLTSVYVPKMEGHSF